jgi:hypothetical protein
MKKNKINIIISMMILGAVSCTSAKKPVEQPPTPTEVVESEEPYIGNIEAGVHNVRNITEVDDMVLFQWQNSNGKWIYTRLPKRYVTYVYFPVEIPTIELWYNTNETASENLISAIITISN